MDDPATLHEHLDRLHEQLNSGDVDPESRDRLRAIMDDIRRQLAGHADGDNDERASAAATPEAQPMPMSDRLERMAAQFEGEHPTLAASSRRLIDLLGKVGL